MSEREQADAMRVMAEELRELRSLMEAVVQGMQPASQSRPITAQQLIERWAVPGDTDETRLDNLASRCRQRGLKPMKGTRGMAATYMIADVIAAEAYSNGTTKRRRRVAA